MTIRNRITTFFAVSLMLTAAASLFVAPIQAEESEVAIKVDGETVKKSELEKQVERTFQRMKQQYGQQLQNEAAAEKLRKRIRKQVIDQRVNQLILKTNAQKSDVSVSEQEVEKRVQSTQEQFDSEGQLKKTLQKRDMSMEDFRSQIREQLLVKKFVEKNVGQINVTDEEAKQYYEKNKQRFQGQPFEKIKPKIKQSLAQQRQQEKRQELVSELREKTEVDVRV